MVSVFQLQENNKNNEITKKHELSKSFEKNALCDYYSRKKEKTFKNN